MNPGIQCSYNQTLYGCRQVWPISPVRQAQINNRRVCGATNGGTYVNVTRPNKATNVTLGFECPYGTEICSSFTNNTNSICVPVGTKSTQCPVTDIKFIVDADLVTYNTNASDTSKPLYYSSDYTTGSKLIYSKEADSMPITTFQVAEGPHPCMDPQDQAGGSLYYPLELV